MRNAHTPARRQQKAKRGFTLTEMAIVLGIIGTILGAIWSAASHANQNQKTSKAVAQILTIVQGIKQLYPSGALPAGGADLTGMLQSNGVFPPEMISSAGALVNPWGTGVDVQTQTGAGGVVASVNMVTVWYGVLTQPQCVGMLTNLATQATTIGLNDVYTDGTGHSVYSAAAPWTPASFAACSGNILMNFKIN